MASSVRSLDHFIDAQAAVYAQVVAELREGRKKSHWMWFIFPQLEGLGHSSTARRFALSGLAEARAYFAHPLLGARLLECTALALAAPGACATDVFGTPDDLKLHASMTLFARAAPRETPFHAVLQRWFDGRDHAATDGILSRDPCRGEPRDGGAAAP